jgi:hypothetical protein
MKYTKEQYISTMQGYFGPDEDSSNNVMSLVRVRVAHECMGVDKDDDHGIEIGDMAVREVAIHRELGRVSCYICLPCADKWLDELEVNTENL